MSVQPPIRTPAAYADDLAQVRAHLTAWTPGDTLVRDAVYQALKLMSEELSNWLAIWTFIPDHLMPSEVARLSMQLETMETHLRAALAVKPGAQSRK